jgi:hypothetical protein
MCVGMCVCFWLLFVGKTSPPCFGGIDCDSGRLL